jgi:hypothetical protein
MAEKLFLLQCLVLARFPLSPQFQHQCYVGMSPGPLFASWMRMSCYVLVADQESKEMKMQKYNKRTRGKGESSEMSYVKSQNNSVWLT